MCERPNLGARREWTIYAELTWCKILGLKPFTQEPYQFDADYVARLTAGDPDICNHFAEYFTRVLDLMLAVREWTGTCARHPAENAAAGFDQLNRSGTIVPDQFAAYVMGVFRNKLREEIHRIKHPQSPDIEPEGTGTSAEDEFVNARNKERTLCCFTRNARRDRRVIQLLFLEEAEREEACRQLGVDRGALRVRLARASQRFRN